MPSDTFNDRAGQGLSGNSWDNNSSSTGSMQSSGSGQDSVSRIRDQAEQQGSAALNSLKEGARSLGEEAHDRASGYVEGGKQAVTDSLEAFAQAIRRASDELNERDQTMAAQLIRQGASTLERVTRSIEGTSLDDMVRQVRTFARNNPMAFVGGAMLAGFAVARFARASSRPDTSDWNRSGEAWRGDDRGYGGSEEWSRGGSSAGGLSGSPYSGSSAGAGGGFGSSSSAGGGFGSSSAGGSSFGGSGSSFGGSGGAGGRSSFSGGAAGGGSSFGSSGAGSSYPSNTGGSGDVPPGSQGYAGGGMDSDPIQSSGPSSETDESMSSSSSGSGGGLGSGSISTGGNT